MKKEEKELIKKFFRQFPLSHAIPRANEALVLREVRLVSPILDLGCGDGKFARLTFGAKSIDVGLDKSPKEIKKAQGSGAYRQVFALDAKKLPFDSGEFGSVVSNSVLEHMDHLEAVLKEVARVMSPGGKLVFTVPTPLVCRYQFWSKFIPGWAKFKRKIWRHINYFGEDGWQKRLASAGFEVVSVKKTNSKAAISWADVFFPLSWIGPKPGLVPFFESSGVFGESDNGATLLIIARKNADKTA